AAVATRAATRDARDLVAKPAERLDAPTEPRAKPSVSAPVGSAPAPGSATTSAATPPPEGRAVIRPDTELALELIVPKEGITDAWLGVFVPDPAAFRRAAGRSLPGPGEVLRLSLADLTGPARVRVLREIFPGSGPHGADWIHPVGKGRLAPSQETIDRLAGWYCGDPAHALEIAAANHLKSLKLPHGKEIVIPAAILLPEFAATASHVSASATPTKPAAPSGREAARPAAAAGADAGLPILEPLPDRPGAASPAASSGSGDGAGEPEDDFTEAPTPEEGEEELTTPTAPGQRLAGPPPAAEGAQDLRYSRDGAGPYAIYRLKRGEALYTAVVVRFTGRIDVQEVNDLAARIAARSGIADVTGIPVGFPVKIGLDDLLPEYLPREDSRRQAWERSHAAVEQYAGAPGRHDLAGVVVILDAGHGGRDIGASHHGVWEHDYVYDILCRVKALLETTTKARVLPTIKDRKDGFTIQDARRLSCSKSECLLSNPTFPLTQGVSNVNMRWYLSNAWFRRLVEAGTDPDSIVFTSLHADARHPSLHGAMVYVPGSEYRRGRYGSSGAVYARYKEAREAPFVTFTREERERSEGLSRRFAASLIDAFEAGGVDVHPYGPVRERIIRQGRSFVPAVLRCNVVPVQVLIEVSNLSNQDDGRALTDPAYRQKVAEAYVEGLRRYFSGSGGPRPTAASASTAGAERGKAGP
ncbi:MAG TPA: N-acetylmuramoyl-L-alanine amidase, partial [Dongiaceae bacterium]|nr:N-acetylmuramoyl-L-alanine amidase [Dongiaceae bacterium]